MRKGRTLTLADLLGAAVKRGIGPGAPPAEDGGQRPAADKELPGLEDVRTWPTRSALWPNGWGEAVFEGRG